VTRGGRRKPPAFAFLKFRRTAGRKIAPALRDRRRRRPVKTTAGNKPASELLKKMEAVPLHVIDREGSSPMERKTRSTAAALISSYEHGRQGR
jgi:hypothetical protein